MQQTGRVRRRWGATVVGSLAAVALAAGCTGDEGVQVVTEGVDGTAALAAAVEATPTSGRFLMTMRMEMPDMFWPDDELADDEATDETVAGEGGFEIPTSINSTVDGEFSGEDMRGVVTGDFGAGEYRSESIKVGDRLFTSANTMLDMYGAIPGDDSGFGDSLAKQRAAMEEALAGKDWVSSAATEYEEYDESEEEMGGIFGQLLGPGSFGTIADPTAVLADVAEVRETDPVDDDGERLRRFVGVVPHDELFSGSFDPEPDDTSPEAVARVERIEAYAASRTTSSVEVLVGPDGFVRRIQLELSDDFEDQYQGCYFLTENGSLSMTVELSDLGAPIEITAPEPTTVIDESALDTAGELIEVPVVDEGGSADDEFDPSSLTSMYGREDAEAMLLDGASLIGLDPATIPSMTDEQVDESLAQIEEAAATLPTFDTPLGPQNRLEMLSSIRVGTDMLGIEPLGLSTSTDQELADLITKFIDEEGMDFGLTSDEDLEDLEDLEGFEEFEYDEFEGCPA